jgi:two-component SAPR family response regulator
VTARGFSLGKRDFAGQRQRSRSLNLGDGLVYTVAEVLEQRGVPFVFVTGYDVDSIDSRFTAIPILQKPIEREMLQRFFVQGATSNRAVAV